MALDGVEIFTNSSGSHHELRKLKTRIDLIKEATLKVRYSRLENLSSVKLTFRCLCISLVDCISTRTSKVVMEIGSTTTAAPSSPSTEKSSLKALNSPSTM